MSEPTTVDVFTTGPTWRAIGMELPSEARADEVLGECSDRVVPLRQTEAAAVYHYVDRSGAVILYDVAEERIVDLRQGFAGTRPTSARWVLLGSSFALVDILAPGTTGPALEESPALARACVALHDGFLNEPGKGGSGEMIFTALAQRPELYADSAAYAASETARTLASAADQADAGAPAPLPVFISLGAYAAISGQPAHAGAVFAARILEAELHSNTMTSQNFWVIEADAGFPLTICVGEADLTQRPRRGNILAGEFAIMGATGN